MISLFYVLYKSKMIKKQLQREDFDSEKEIRDIALKTINTHLRMRKLQAIETYISILFIIVLTCLIFVMAAKDVYDIVAFVALALLAYIPALIKARTKKDSMNALIELQHFTEEKLGKPLYEEYAIQHDINLNRWTRGVLFEVWLWFLWGKAI